MELIDIVKKLNGPVTAVGESKEDQRRLKNLDNLINLTDSLVMEIFDASKSANNHQDSMKKIGRRAKAYLNDLQEGVRGDEKAERRPA